MNHHFLCLVLFLSGCGRETRCFREIPPGAQPQGTVRLSELAAGGPPPTERTMTRYGTNAYALSQGRDLYHQMNCVGCHAHGGGGIGPPLMDDQWLYGSDPAQIFRTIVEGRPNGMPSFDRRLGNQQVWQLVAYVRSLSGLTGSSRSSSREDHMYVSPNLILRPRERPGSAPRPPP